MPSVKVYLKEVFLYFLTQLANKFCYSVHTFYQNDAYVFTKHLNANILYVVLLHCFCLFAEVLILFKIDLYNLYKYDTQSIQLIHQCHSRMVRFSKIRSALNRSIFVMLCTLVLIFSVTPHQTKHVYLAALISATLTNLKICLKSSKFENGSEISHKVHSVGVVLQID